MMRLGVQSGMKVMALAIALALVTGCAATSVNSPEPRALISEPTVASQPAVTSSLPSFDWTKYDLANEGCFFVRDVVTGDERISDTDRCNMRRPPFSTFKIPNALIGLHLGILDGPDARMIWDQAKYPSKPWWPQGWARDQPLRSAMAISAVPLFRRLATEIGADKMQSFVDAFHYGNRDISGGLDRFWLDGALRISAREQVDFISELARRQLPIDQHAQQSIREVLRRSQHTLANRTANLFGKTGGGHASDRPTDETAPIVVGWMVGWVETANATLAYALWTEAPSFPAVTQRRDTTLTAIVKDILADTP